MARSRKNIVVQSKSTKQEAIGRTTSNKTTESATTDLDFETAVELFVREQKIKHLSPNTIKWQQECLWALQKFFVKQNQPTTPSKITSRMLKENFVLYQLETLQLSPSTINGRILTIRSFFRFLTDEGYIKSNPDNLTRIKARKQVIQAFSYDQIRTLLGTPDRTTFTGIRDYTIMMLLLETGMRVSELAGLTLDDIRWTENKLLVLGKGDKERMIPFQRKMKSVLQNYVSVRGHVPHETALFLTLDNTPMKRRHIQEQIHDLGVKSGIKGVRISPHTFRHTFAKMYIKNGGDVFSLQAILGHTTLDMVRNYVTMFSADVEEQHKKYSPIEHLSF